MIGGADLHIHTNQSDGLETPEEVVERAAGLALAAIAVADHDALEAVPRAIAAGEQRGIEVLPAVEISAECGRAEVHILGYGVDPGHAELAGVLQELRRRRDSRARQIIQRLQVLGIPAPWESLKEESDGAVGRLHIARFLYRSGHSRSVQHAFDRFLKRGKPAYVPKARIACDEAINLIHAAGGLAFYAHPGIGETRKALRRIERYAFDGLEAYHSRHSPGVSEQLRQFAHERNLLISGGSDCHGGAKGQVEMGKVRLAWDDYMQIVDALQRVG